MSDGTAESARPDGEDADPGEPIRALAEFEHDASDGFLGRVRRTIQRRTTVVQLTSFSWNIPLLILREFWLILVGQLNPDSARKDVRHGRETS